MQLLQESANQLDLGRFANTTKNVVTVLEALEAEVRAICFDGTLRDVEEALDLSNTAHRLVYLARSSTPNKKTVLVHLNLLEASVQNFAKKAQLLDQISLAKALTDQAEW